MKPEHILNWCDNGSYEVNKGYTWEQFLEICDNCEFACWIEDQDGRFYPRRSIGFPYYKDKEKVKESNEIRFFNGPYSDIVLPKDRNSLIRVVDNTFLLLRKIEIRKEDEGLDDDGYPTFSGAGIFEYKETKIKFVEWKLFNA